MDWKNCFRVTTTYIGAVLGAGFISGQEILQFFVIYGQAGLLGTLIAGLLFAGLAVSVIFIGYNLQVTNYYQLFYCLGGKKLGKLIDVVFSLFLLGSLLVMLAGCKEVFTYFFSGTINWGLIITLLIVISTNLYGLEGVMNLNSILIPLLLTISLVTIISLNTTFNFVLSEVSWSFAWVTSSFVYVGYNIMLGLVVLLPLTAKMGKSELIWGVSSGGLGLGLFAFVIGFTLASFYPKIVSSELPMLEIIDKQNSFLYYIYGLVLWLAMVTTASCNLYGIVARWSDLLKISQQKLIASVVVIVLPIIRFSFSRLVELIYPWLGKISVGLISGLIIIYIGRGIYRGCDENYY